MKHTTVHTQRRFFLKSLAAGITLVPGGLSLRTNAASATTTSEPLPDLASGKALRTHGRIAASGRFREDAREIPIAGHSDVLVVGAGPAGIGAAIAAARAGAKTQLIECAGCLGGIWTAGQLTKIIDGNNKTGLMRDILAQMSERGSPVAKQSKGAIYDPELMKLVLEELCVAAGVKIQLHTQLVGAVVDERKRITAVITESKSGRQAWTADRFIDCSGDGDLAAHAGCGFDLGVGEQCECQPMTLMALLTGIDLTGAKDYIRELGGEAAKARLYKYMKASGIHPSYAAPTLRHLYGGIFSIMTNHEYGVPAFDAGKITEATIRARAEVHGIVAALRKLGGPWKDIAVVATAEQIGIREGRRIHGRYTVTAEDMISGKRHEVAACRVSFGIDIHNLWPEGANPREAELMKKARQTRQAKVKPYDVPLAALIAADVDGLMMAGRCISGDFIAHASYRVTGDSVPMGEAAGQASAISLRKGVMPQELTGADLKAAGS